MFTKNNYVLTPGLKYGDPYVKTNIADIKPGQSVITLQMPRGDISFATEVAEVQMVELDMGSPENPPTIYRLTFENAKGKLYEVELDPTDVDIFCKYSKFRNLGLFLKWNANFVTYDWTGTLAKLVEVEEVPVDPSCKYHYKIITKDASAVLVGGILFASKNIANSANLSELE